MNTKQPKIQVMLYTFHTQEGGIVLTYEPTIVTKRATIDVLDKATQNKLLSYNKCTRESIEDLVADIQMHHYDNANNIIIEPIEDEDGKTTFDVI